MPPFMPALAELEPLPLIQPSASSTCRRLARIDLPAPGPPHMRKKKLTSWNLLHVRSIACWVCVGVKRMSIRVALHVRLKRMQPAHGQWG